jgi:hypothetical protein
MSHAIKQQQHTELTAPYMGIDIVKGWISSNFTGTVRHYATLPNGQKVSSPVRTYLTKRIKKYFTENK